ncbi:unnamed protein product [Calypogeia fissa]
MPMELGNLQQQANIVPRPVQPQRHFWQPNGGFARGETRQCYWCGRVGHIQPNCRWRGGPRPNRRSLNKMEIHTQQREENEENL